MKTEIDWTIGDDHNIRIEYLTSDFKICKISTSINIGVTS